ncbi:MAG: hypothetical protein AB1513_02635 [Pseudomonadota bacterium]
MQQMPEFARLAPDIVEGIARGRQPVGLSLLFFVESPLPDDWNAQRRVIGGLAK